MRAETCLEFFRQKVANRDTSEYHIVDHTKALREREKNDGPQPKTRFQIELDDPELYRRWNAAKDRIIKRCRNKAIALDLMHRAWCEALSDSELDKILAEIEGPSYL
jgi:hypothetical protein